MAFIDTEKLIWRATSHGTPCLYKEDVDKAVEDARSDLKSHSWIRKSNEDNELYCCPYCGKDSLYDNLGHAYLSLYCPHCGRRVLQAE